MYLYIFENNPGKILILPKAPLLGSQLTQEASVIFSFHEKYNLMKLMKNRYGKDIDVLAEQYLGIRLFDDGFFISDKELMIFVLKYNNLSGEKVVDFPLV